MNYNLSESLLYILKKRLQVENETHMCYHSFIPATSLRANLVLT